MEGVGVLCHLSSLPSQDISDVKNFLNLLKKYDIDHWQVLPLSPPDAFGSPYASNSAFAAWDKWIEEYQEVGTFEEWMTDWGYYSAIRSEHDNQEWFHWPKDLKNKEKDAMKPYSELAKSHVLKQQKFNAYWSEIRKHASSLGISLIGDLPMYVTHGSSDVWSHRELFLLNQRGKVELVAGVPPDYFSKKGQKWGNVLYDWDAHRREHFFWWKARIRRMLDLFDHVRIDHFRGFHSAWAIPSHHKTARKGHWIEGPKDMMVEAIIEAAEGDVYRILAEDLGIIPKEVVELRKKYSISGMSILQFGFSEPSEENPHHPLNIASDTIAYTGTHDNQTTNGWWKDQTKRGKNQISKLFEMDEEPVWELINLAIKSNAKAVIIPVQDLMELGDEARMNKPGTTSNNWNWKLNSHQDLEQGLDKLATLRKRIITR